MGDRLAGGSSLASALGVAPNGGTARWSIGDSRGSEIVTLTHDQMAMHAPS